MNKTLKTIGWGLRGLPLLVVVAELGASIYAAYNKIAGITYGSAIVFGVVILLWIVGIILTKNERTIKKQTE